MPLKLAPGWVRGQQTVCVLKIGLKFPAPLIKTSYFAEEYFSDVGGGGRGAEGSRSIRLTHIARTGGCFGVPLQSRRGPLHYGPRWDCSGLRASSGGASHALLALRGLGGRCSREVLCPPVPRTADPPFLRFRSMRRADQCTSYVPPAAAKGEGGAMGASRAACALPSTSRVWGRPVRGVTRNATLPLEGRPLCPRGGRGSNRLFRETVAKPLTNL